MRDHRWDSLAELINKFVPESGVEIGVKDGTNLYKTLSKFSFLEMAGVDPWKGSCEGSQFDSHEHQFHYEMTLTNIAPFKRRVRLLKMDSEEASKLFADGTVGFVFIDGDHSYEGCKRDIEVWLPKVKSGGFICGHDYESPYFEGVTQAVDELIPNANALDCRKERSKVWWTSL